MALIFFGSGPVGANQNTSRFLAPIIRWFVPDIPDEALRRAQVLVRKTGHLTEYAVLSVLLLRARLGSNRARQVRLLQAASFAVLAAAAFAVTDELHQSFVPGREGSPVDVMIDVTGATAGVAVVLWARRIQHQRTVRQRGSS